MVWVGLVIGLLSALVATFSELKRPRGVKPWSHRFIVRNRFKVAAACLAVLGFLAAALTYRQEQAHSEAAERRLKYENDILKSLMLSGRQVSPVVRIVIATDTPLDPAPRLQELAAWMEGGATTELPRAIGFVPAQVRDDLFRGAQPTTALKGAESTITLRPGLQKLGYIDLLADDFAVRKLRYQFSVGTDGSAITAVLSSHLKDLRTDVFQTRDHRARIAFDFRVTEPLEALELFGSVAGMYERRFPLLMIRVATRDCDERKLANRHRLARVEISLDEQSELWDVANLEEARPGCENDGETRYEWHFKEPPELSVSKLGGFN